MKMFVILVLICTLFPGLKTERGESVGCFTLNENLLEIQTGGSVESCTSSCGDMYYRYSILTNGSSCFCGNSAGKTPTDSALCDNSCSKNTSQICGGRSAGSVYDTGVTSPGPPPNIKVDNITETTAHLWWKEPLAHPHIMGYKINAVVLKTYASYTLPPLEWTFSNNTFHTELLNLHPGTKYNITVCALSRERCGALSHLEVETEIGEPDPAPPQVVIVQRHSTHMVVHIPEATNINGPVSKYRLVVMNKNFQQNFLPDYLKPYREAAEEGLPYYITAEVDLYEAKNDFVIGDGRNRNGFYNAPLQDTKDIQVALGVVSSNGRTTKIRYNHASDIMVLNVNQNEQTYWLVAVLCVAIAIGVVLLVIGIGAVIVLRKKVGLSRRQRLSQSMPLSGPCIEIENTGFIPDEEERVDHYVNLKRQLWNIPRNFLEVDISTSVGSGSYGPFVRGRVQHQGTFRPALVQSISDGELTRADKKTMLSELDLLIKSNGHENIVSLIGICEIPDTLYVVLEDTRHTLKELLLSSRHRDIQSNKFCLTTESKVLQICLDISKGMEYLSGKRIVHKRLCCRNIIMADGTVPKISGFGLSHMFKEDEKPDYTRWTAQEMFKQNTYAPKSDVWAFGCLVWETMSLGGTPYPHVATKDVANRVLRGMRPPQLHYVGDDLYQVCLHCWQLDLDERPWFSELVMNLTSLSNQNISGMLNFTHYNGFQYESHNQQLEIIN